MTRPIPPEARALSHGVMAVPGSARMASLRKYWRVNSEFKRVEMQLRQPELRELRRGGLDNLDKNLNDRAESEATEIVARAVGAPTVRFEGGRVKVGA